MGLGLLWSFNYAIYDGLEMILKVTKNAKNVYCEHSMVKMMMMDESVIVSSVICLLFIWRKSTFFSSKWSWKEVKWSMEVYYPPCMSQMVLKAANSVCIHNGLEMSQFTVSVPNGLERSQLWVLALACCCIL